jgi:adenine phosphoribosyltransferase
MSLELLKKTLLDAPIVKMGEYQYVIHPITDGVPVISHELLIEVTDEIYNKIRKIGKIDKIATIEAMGIPLASILSVKIGVPFNIIRKRKYGLANEISVEQVTGYSKAKLFINGLNKGDKIVIVDDVLSTGGTLKAVLSVLKKIGVQVKGVFIAIDKGNVSGRISNEFGIKISPLVNIDVVNGKTIIK